MIRVGDQSPWGIVETVRQYTPDACFVSTAAHGGVHLSGDALRAVPAEVRASLREGEEWAEEDCEANIVMAILDSKGLLDERQMAKWDRPGLYLCAIQTAAMFARYNGALAHLPAPSAAAG